MKALTAITAAVLIVLVGATAAGAHVFYHGHRVTTQMVGGISAAPCPQPDEDGDCAAGVVALRWRGFEKDHIVHCEHAPALHVQRIDHQGRAVVYACRTFYHWRLPHAG